MDDASCPFLFVIGPQRSGTTWLYSFLKEQPEGIYLDRLEKENYRFSNPSSKSPEAERVWFLNRISGEGPVQLCADVCSTYFGHQHCVEAILASFPEAKFIYIRRDEASRRKSFAAHRGFNALSAWILGYNISWKLYERQADFDGFDAWMKTRLPEDKLRVLDFADLKADGGESWVAAMTDLTGVSFQPIQQGVVNKSRKDASLLRRVMFIGVRLIQATRVHILIRQIKMRSSHPELSSAAKRGVL